MSLEESNESRQTNELEVLQAIYGTELKDCRGKSVWQKWVPLNVTISLTPQQGSSGTQAIYAQIDLHIICSESYPNKAPKILLENSKGLSNALVDQLQKELEERARQLEGEVVIFQLCQQVQEFLHSHNKPSAKSFYDEMLQMQKEKELKELEARQLEENRQKQYFLEEVQKRQEMLKSEQRLRREHRYNSENSNEDERDFRRRSSSLNNRARRYSFRTQSFDSNDDCLHKGIALIDFGTREVQRGKCIKHSNENHIVFNGIDTETGELVIVSEWTIQKDNDLAVIQKHISSIEQELNYLTKLSHNNLLHYLNMKWEVNEEEKKVTVYVLKEFVYGSNCSSFQNQSITVDVDFIRHLSRGILTALDYLHRNNVVHKDLKESCVYLNEKGTVKVANYSIHRRLCDLNQSHAHNYGKKTDIYSFGLLLLSLMKGSIDKDNFDVPNISAEMYDFLTKCVSKDEKDRYTAYQLLGHPFLKKTVQFTRPQIIPVRKTSPDIIQTEPLFPHPQSGQRFNNEFQILDHLGKGAFGEVFKVRNKLDDRFYAIKKIQLNPKNKQLNKKIVREVKLLSRLNHENVVRYYNSWIEEQAISESDTDNSSEVEAYKAKDEFSLSDDIEAQAPPKVDVSMNFEKSQSAFASDESSDDEGWFHFDNDSDSDGIEFEHSPESIKESSTSITSNNLTFNETKEHKIEYMYIQMEFCEKSTLRTAIDDNLYQDEDRVWRLFREIVEGLAHIHQQGMIHRDLKPVNIFLDFQDHVKIGDFGLATTDIKSRQNEYTVTKSALESDVDESKTGLVGTALYVAPEIGTNSKAIYNQKVDIYSLGVILFEMCYRPLNTSMERIKVLNGIRLREIVLPEDFICKNNQKQEYLIRWLLNHDISKRPSSQELLQSEYVPPPVLEECELRELVRHTLSNPHLKGYKYLIASCFKQSVTPAQDITYDNDPTVSNSMRPLQLYDYVKQITLKVFKNHGGRNLSTPLLMPKSKFYENLDLCVKLMTHFGSIVTLPHDLRVPFARFVAWNGTTFLRRYSIERVYRERKVFGFLPRELYECAFDIVSPTPGSLMSDGEVLYIVYEIINALPALKDKHFVIHLNHTLLLKAILLYCGIKENHEDLYKLISDSKEGKVAKNHVPNYLGSLGLSDNNIQTFMGFVNSEFEVNKAVNHFQMIIKKRTGEASQLAKQALQELKTIAANAEAFGVTFHMVVVPGLIYNMQQYSGMVCKFLCEMKKKHKHGNMEVLAAGGRYDSMIAMYRNIMEQANMLKKDVCQSAVGISISLDKLVQAIQKESDDVANMNYLDVVVCSVGSKQLVKEKAKLLRSLWSAGIRSSLIEAVNIEEIQEQANELKVPHIIVLKENDLGNALIRSWQRDRFQEKSVSTSEVVETMQRILTAWNDPVQEHFGSIARSESKNFSDRSNEHGQEALVEILFVTVEKLSSNARKRYDNQIRSHLEGVFKRLNGYVIVFGLSLESNVIKTLSSYLDFENESAFQASVKLVIERHQRLKKYLNDVCDEIFEQKSKQRSPIVVLYSFTEYFYKVIV